MKIKISKKKFFLEFFFQARVPPVARQRKNSKKIEKSRKKIFVRKFVFQNPLLTFLSDFRFCYFSCFFAVTRPMSAVTRPMWKPSGGLRKKRPDSIRKWQSIRYRVIRLQSRVFKLNKRGAKHTEALRCTTIIKSVNFSPFAS